ncbi:MAG: hypothetical protein J2P25_03850 [Nocardiopsaceae bacterium]|nr:hypothetical protein [Nocardiopsaceae bacterium]
MSEPPLTGNPIGGNPAALEQTAANLKQWGASLQEAGHGLASIDTTAGWTGPAADQFRKVFDTQPARWTQAGDAFTKAGDALLAYVPVLKWAQGQAAAHLNSPDTLKAVQAQLAPAASTAAQALNEAAALAPAEPSLISRIWHGIESIF